MSDRGARDRVAELQRSFPAIAPSIPLARRSAVEFAGAVTSSRELLESVALAATEAVTNVVLHAYPDSDGAATQPAVHLSAWIAADELWLHVADDGCGLQPGRARVGGLGLGLALIVQISDGLSIHARPGGGTELRIRFKLPDGGQSRGSRASATLPASPRFSTTR